MGRLSELARAHGLALLEDAAQAIGARAPTGLAGGMGKAGCFSFFPSKNLGAWGDGGAVVTDDERVAEKVRSLGLHGLAPGERDLFVEPGMNSRLDALQAAVLRVKASHLEAWTEGRRAVARRYRALLEGIPGLELPDDRPEEEGWRHVFHQYVVRTPERDALARHLAEGGVETRVYYARPLHRQPGYLAYAEAEGAAEALPHADAASRSLLALPMFAELTEDEQGYVAAAIQRFFG
jgi:dTDP-4-amino-4,6-dideoxygalactose transaminase